MSNIEQFAPAQFTEGFNVNQQETGTTIGNAPQVGAANLNFKPEAHSEHIEPPPNPDHIPFKNEDPPLPPQTYTEMRNQQATDEAITEAALEAAEFGNEDREVPVPDAGLDEGVGDANNTKIVSAQPQDGDYSENARPNEENDVSFETQQSQHELGMEAGKNNANIGVDPQYTSDNVNNMQKEVMEMEMEGGNIDQEDMNDAQNKLQFGRGYIDGYGQQQNATEAAAEAAMNGEGTTDKFTNYADAKFDGVQTGGDGFRLGVDAEMVGGQAVVNGYDNEQHVCGGYGEELAPQEGGGSPFNFITDPESGLSMSIFSGAGKALLKRYVKSYKHMQSGGEHCGKTGKNNRKSDGHQQSGGAALLDGVDVNSPGALYDEVQNAGAENMADACGLTYDAHGDVWTHTQVGGGKKRKSKKCKCGPNCKECKKHNCRDGKQCNC